MLHDQGATDEQHFEMLRLLIDTYDLACIVPGTRFIRPDLLSASSGTHNSRWRDKGFEFFRYYERSGEAVRGELPRWSVRRSRHRAGRAVFGLAWKSL